MDIRDDLHDSKIIVAVARDSQIHMGMQAFQLIASGLFDKLITLAEAKFMAVCEGAGETWAQLLATQAIVGLDELGQLCFVKGGLIQPKAIAPIEQPAAPLEGELIIDSEQVA